MANIFLIGCPHFGHESMYRFTRSNGEKVRPFANATEGDAVMLQRWNETVNPKDKVYVLGDVAFHNTHLKILSLLHGSKILIKGNHDNMKPGEYLKYFKDIRAYHRLDKFVLSHIPIHPNSLYQHKTGKWWTNIHAHLHSEAVMEMHDEHEPMRACQMEDPRYFSVCVERINYTPISLEEIRKRT